MQKCRSALRSTVTLLRIGRLGGASFRSEQRRVTPRYPASRAAQSRTRGRAGVSGKIKGCSRTLGHAGLTYLDRLGWPNCRLCNPAGEPQRRALFERGAARCGHCELWYQGRMSTGLVFGGSSGMLKMLQTFEVRESVRGRVMMR